MKLDSTEKQLLRLLQSNGRATNVELAAQLSLSESPCLRRVRAMEDAGLIEGYSARLNQRKLGLQVTAFVLVSLEKSNRESRVEFCERVAEEDFIIECHALSGTYDYMLKIVAYSMDHFSELSMNRISGFPGVKNIESQFSLIVIKENSPLPV